LRLVIHADKSATWKYAFWLLSLAFSPERGGGTAEFVVREDAACGASAVRFMPLAWCVWEDPVYPSGLEGRSLALDDEDWVVGISAFRMGWRDPARSRTRIRLQWDWRCDFPAWALETRSPADALGRAALLETLEGKVKAIVGGVPPDARVWGRFTSPPPKGPNVPVGDALALLQVLRAHVEGPIGLEGITLPGFKTK